MEDWLADFKDTCRYNLGESGMPDSTVGELLARSGESCDALQSIVLRDNDTRGTERLRNAICATYRGDVPFDNITVTTGTSEALFILFNILLEKKKAAVVPMPSFQALYEIPRAVGAEIREYRLVPENGYIPDTDEICSLIDDSVGVVVLNTPHNPSGVLIPDECCVAIKEKAVHHGAVVLSDEHYRFLPHDNDFPLKTLACQDGSVIATGSLTKCFGLIGLRVGWIAAPPSLIGRIRDFRDYITHTLSPVSDYLASIALEHYGDFAAPVIHRLRKNRRALRTMVDTTPGLTLVEPEAGVVAFPGYEYDVTSDAFARGLIERHGVFVLPGSAFEVEKHVRINLGQEPERFSEALGLIKKYCRSFL